MESYSKAQSLLQKLVMCFLYSPLKHLLITVNVRRFLFILHLTKGDQVTCCQASLTSRRNKYYYRLTITELFNMVVGWLVHSCHSRTVMLLTETLKMNFYRNWPYWRPEVEKSICICSEPFSNISSIGHSCWQSNHSNFPLFIHSGDDNFKHSSSLLS